MSVASTRGAPGQRQPKTKPPFGSVRKPLAKKQSSRHIKQADYLALIGSAKASQGGRCLGHIAGIEHDCTDPFDFIHAVDQQAIVRKLGEGHPALTDPRLGGYACRFIHGSFDHWSGPLREVEARANFVPLIHPDIYDAAKEYGLDGELDRKVAGA